MGGPYINFGINRILDAQLNFVRNTVPVYLRIRNFPLVNATLAGQLGFALTPTGSNVGTEDILIGPPVSPPPAVRMISMHNIGMSGGKLLMGAKDFTLTQTFVRYMLAKLNDPAVQDGLTLWKSRYVVGLFTDGKMYSIEDIAHEEMGGVTVVWSLRCNANMLK